MHEWVQQASHHWPTNNCTLFIDMCICIWLPLQILLSYTLRWCCKDRFCACFVIYRWPQYTWKLNQYVHLSTSSRTTSQERVNKNTPKKHRYLFQKFILLSGRRRESIEVGKFWRFEIFDYFHHSVCMCIYTYVRSFKLCFALCNFNLRRRITSGCAFPLSVKNKEQKKALF